jgi:hypothetical protein
VGILMLDLKDTLTLLDQLITDIYFRLLPPEQPNPISLVVILFASRKTFIDLLNYLFSEESESM